MPRTITIGDEQYEDALRAILARLKDELDIAAAEIELSSGPLDAPHCHDVQTHLRRARRTFEAVEALGWPDGAQATKQDEEE